MIRVIPKWARLQWLGALMMAVGCIASGLCVGWLLPQSHAISPVPLAELGLATDHADKAAVVAASLPPFLLVGDAAGEDNSKKNVRLWEAVLQLRGEHLPNVPQQIGDCVSWGAANAVNYLQAVQIIRGPPAEFHPAYPPFIYGASRVDIGRKHGSRFNGDGSVGAYAAEALRDLGVLRADLKDCPPYTGQVARQWGASGPPAWAKEEAKKQVVKSIAQVSSAKEAMDAIAGAHCPVTIASGWWGTTDIPVVNGRRVARRTTSWAHQQCLIAYDGSGPGEPLFYCVNSWGPNAHPAPMQGEPPGGYWIRWSDVDRICKEGDSWAISSFDGFEAAGPNWDELLRRPATSSVAISRDFSDRGGFEMRYMMESPGILLALFLAIALGGLVLFLMARTRHKAGFAAGLLAVIGLCGIGSAQDFAQAASRSPLPNVPSAAVNDATVTTGTGSQTQTTPADPMDWTAATIRPKVDLLASGCHEVVAEAPQALVFVMERGCADCDRIQAYIQKTLIPKGWTSSVEPDADFRIIDIRKNPEIARLYGVEMVPTLIYLNRTGRIVDRRVGFQSGQQWTAPLLSCR